jgi:hypothetical protein
LSGILINSNSVATIVAGNGNGWKWQRRSATAARMNTAQRSQFELNGLNCK